jgi:hypothetical protein
MLNLYCSVEWMRYDTQQEYVYLNICSSKCNVVSCRSIQQLCTYTETLILVLIYIISVVVAYVV